MNGAAYSHIEVILHLLPRPPWVTISDEEASRRLRIFCNERQLQYIRETVEGLTKEGRILAVQIGPEGLLHFNEARKLVLKSQYSAPPHLKNINDQVVAWMALTTEGRALTER